MTRRLANQNSTLHIVGYRTRGLPGGERLNCLSPDGKLRTKPSPSPELRVVLRNYEAEIVALLTRSDIPARDPSFPDVEPDLRAESEALATGWTRNPDGSWEFPPGWWTGRYPATPEGHAIDWDGIEALRQAGKVPLPDDSQPRPGLRTLTEDEKRQIRTAGTPMPKGVSFGQTATGQWRRLT